MKTDVKKWITGDGMLFLNEIGIKEEQFVLDFGCNVGHYTIPAAKVVGEAGKVYAVDKDKNSLNELMNIANESGLENILPIFIESKGLKITLEDRSVDAILLYDVLHYMNSDGRGKIYKECYRILKNGGFLSVYPKHIKSDRPMGELSNMDLKDVKREIEKVGFAFKDKINKQLLHDDSYNMGNILNFTKIV